MRHTKHLNALLVSLLGATTLVTSCRGNTTASSDPDTLLRNGSVLIAAGSEQVEVYNPASRTFSTGTGRMDAARFYSTATLLADGRVLVAGGYDSRSLASAKAWLYKA